MYMKILYINDKNAKSFDKQVNNHPVFAKYFSPSCPACIAMETEWDDMCKDIDDKYNTDLLLAQIDPSGMKTLEKTHTYSDVDYVPHIVILENGKKVKEYNGPKNKDDMIAFLMESGYLKNKMTGGSKSKKNKHRKNRRSKKGCGISDSREHPLEGDGSEGELINELNNAMDETDVQRIENTLRENTQFPSFVRNDTTINEYNNCVYDGIFKNCSEKICRKSPGFFNRCIPKNRKFNPSITPETKINAENAYKKMIMINLFKDYNTIKIIENIFPKIEIDFNSSPEKINQQKREKRENQHKKTLLKKNIETAILGMNYDDIDIENIADFTRRLQELVIRMSNERPNITDNGLMTDTDVISMTLQNKMSQVAGNKKGKNNRTTRKKSCRGKRDGKSGCRKCCKRKSKRKYTKCIKRCMR